MKRWLVQYVYDGGDGVAKFASRVVEAENSEKAKELAAKKGPAKDFVLKVTEETPEHFLGLLKGEVKGRDRLEEFE